MSGRRLSGELEDLRDMIAHASRAVIFTGAGISTESGIPDFRSPGGVWDKMPPVTFDDFLSSDAMRRETWRRRFAMGEMFAGARPNAGHLAVAELRRAAGPDRMAGEAHAVVGGLALVGGCRRGSRRRWRPGEFCGLGGVAGVAG